MSKTILNKNAVESLIEQKILEATISNKLDLNLNNIGDEGAETIAATLKSAYHPYFISLDFRSNKIGDEGASAIATA